MLKANAAAMKAMMEHIDFCKICNDTGDLCEPAKPMYEAFRLARMRSRLYFGDDPSISLPE